MNGGQLRSSTKVTTKIEIVDKAKVVEIGLNFKFSYRTKKTIYRHRGCGLLDEQLFKK